MPRLEIPHNYHGLKRELSVTLFTHLHRFNFLNIHTFDFSELHGFAKLEWAYSFPKVPIIRKTLNIEK